MVAVTKRLLNDDLIEFLKTNLPILLEKKLKNNFNNKSQKEIIQETFLEVNNNLKNHKDIDSQYR